MVLANMPELMSSCDIAITSRGRTGYELALLGIPSIAMAQNQREEKHGLFAMRMVSRTLVLTQAMKLSKVFSKCI